MVKSEKEALFHIYHEESLYELGQITKDVLREKLDYFIRVLADYEYSNAEIQCLRVNKRYGFSLEI